MWQRMLQINGGGGSPEPPQTAKYDIKLYSLKQGAETNTTQTFTADEAGVYCFLTQLAGATNGFSSTCDGTLIYDDTERRADTNSRHHVYFYNMEIGQTFTFTANAGSDAGTSTTTFVVVKINEPVSSVALGKSEVKIESNTVSITDFTNNGIIIGYSISNNNDAVAISGSIGTGYISKYTRINGAYRSFGLAYNDGTDKLSAKTSSIGAYRRVALQSFIFT